MIQLPNVIAGDVIFSGAPKMELLFSWAAQLLIDPAARRAKSSFGHVALVVTDYLALEAVPAPDSAEQNLGAWTGETLMFGVRTIPVGDVLVGALGANHKLRVLRNANAPANIATDLSPHSKSLERIVGSAYSVEALKASAEARFNRKIPTTLRDYFDWSAKATDLQARSQLTEEDLRKLCELVPQHVNEFRSRSYFCSQLVQELLELVNLVRKGEIDHRVSPTGLFARLVELGWKDVTATDYSAQSVQALEQNKSARAHAAQSYLSQRALYEMALGVKAGEVLVGTISGSMDKMNETIDRAWDVLDKINPAAAPRK